MMFYSSNIFEDMGFQSVTLLTIIIGFCNMGGGIFNTVFGEYISYKNGISTGLFL